MDERGKVPADPEGAAGRGAGAPALPGSGFPVPAESAGAEGTDPDPPHPPNRQAMAPTGLLVAGASFLAFRGLHWGLRRLGTADSGGTSASPWRTACSRGPGRCSGAGSGARGARGEGEGWEAEAGRPAGRLQS